MCFPFFFLLTKSVVIGIDLGTSSIKTGISKANGVYAANNEQSKKQTPSYFAIWNYTNAKTTRPKNGVHWYPYELEDLTWDYGVRAQRHAERYPKNAIRGFYPLLNESCGLTHREAAAITVRYLLSTVENGVYTPENTVLSFAVDPYVTRHERYALKEIARLANTSLAYIIDSPIAVADYYVISRSRRFSSDTVAFVDIGAHCSWITIFSFSSLGKTEVVMNQKSLTYNETLGGDDIDHIIGDYLYEKFVEETGQATESQKVMNKFYEAGRTAKERLSIDVVFPLHMEDVIGDYGFDYEITRDEFNKLIEPFTDSFRDLLNASMTFAKLRSVDTVEVIGGNTRPQIIQDIIKNITNAPKISHTLNPEDAIVLGTTLLGSTKSSQFKLPKRIKATTFCNVRVDIEVEGKRSNVYIKKDRVNKKKVKCFSVIELLNEKVKIYTDEDYQRPYDIISINIPDEAKDEDDVMISFGFDEYTLPIVTKIECNGEKLNYTHFTPDWRLDDEMFNKSFYFVGTMNETENDRKNSSALRNEFEQYVWTMQKRIYDNEDNYTAFMRSNETEPISEALEENKNWLENNVRPYMRSKVFRERLNKFKNITKDVEMRFEDYMKVPASLDRLNKSIEKVRKYIDTEPKKRPYILWEQCRSKYDDLVEQYHSAIRFLNACEYNYTRMDRSHCMESETNWENIDLKTQVVEISYNSSLTMKKPTPTPRPSPTPPGWKPAEEEVKKEEGIFFRHVQDPDVPEYKLPQFLEKEEQKGDLDLRRRIEDKYLEIRQLERNAINEQLKLIENVNE